MRLTAKSSAAELKEQCRFVGLPLPVLEARFHPTRKWAFDAMWAIAQPAGLMQIVVTPDVRLAVEVEGGIFLAGGGRHNRGAGFRADTEKYAEAAILGYHLIRCLPEDVTSGKTLAWIERFFAARGIMPKGLKR